MQKNQQWKHKVQELFQVAQTEFKRTTEIGKKMLNATKTNTNLNEAYEELGQLAAKALDRGELEWNHSRVKELLVVIKACREDLAKMESEVQNIKFSEPSESQSTSAESPKEETKAETKVESKEEPKKESKEESKPE